MVRVFFVLFSSIILPAVALALPKAPVSLSSSVVLADDDSPGVWHPTEKDCREWPHWAPDDGCAKYKRAAPLTAPAQPGSAQTVALAGPVPPAQQVHPAAAAPAKRALQLNAPWPKPLAPQNKLAALAPPSRPEGLRTQRLRKLAGQLLLSGFEGSQPADAGVKRIAAALRDGKVSGVLIRGPNIENARQLKALISHLAAGGENASALIAVDQPGGPDSVLSEEKGFAVYGAAGAVGSAMPPYEAQLLYRDMATELAAAGITLNIGPSGDVCGEREGDLSADCFGNNPPAVAAFARAFSFAHRDRRVMAALRHGLRRGAVAGDTPSRAMMHGVIKIETGDAAVVRMKTAGLLRLDEPHAGGWKLRDSLQNCGTKEVLLIEWDIEAEGAPVRYRDAIVRAFAAGADMILVREPWRLPQDFHTLVAEAIQKGLESGELPASRIEEAYQHVQRLRQDLGTRISQNEIRF
jgi:beta-N-acetylhexosaminidase